MVDEAWGEPVKTLSDLPASDPVGTTRFVEEGERAFTKTGTGWAIDARYAVPVSVEEPEEVFIAEISDSSHESIDRQLFEEIFCEMAEKYNCMVFSGGKMHRFTNPFKVKPDSTPIPDPPIKIDPHEASFVDELKKL